MGILACLEMSGHLAVPQKCRGCGNAVLSRAKSRKWAQTHLCCREVNLMLRCCLSRVAAWASCRYVIAQLKSAAQDEGPKLVAHSASASKTTLAVEQLQMLWLS